jgi:CBS domain-containing membrane protein
VPLAVRLFAPLLAGATLRDRLLACAGALVGIAAAAALMAGSGLVAPGLPLLVAPIGASAVLAFAVPASPLAQPWPVIGGNTLSALVGVAVALLVPMPTLAGGVAVAAAILAMSLARCLHPPGGAVALFAVLGGPAVAALGFRFALLPVAINSIALVAAAWLFHRLSGHAYPHRPDALAAKRELESEGIRAADLKQALADLGETFDIGTEDLARLVARAEHHAAERRARR